MTVLTVRIGLVVATCFAVACVMPPWAQAQVQARAPGDLGSAECRRQQLMVQAMVGDGTAGAYQALDARTNTAAVIIGSAAATGQITAACGNCILDQLFRNARAADQAPCGGPAATPTVPAVRQQRSPVPTASPQ